MMAGKNNQNGAPEQESQLLQIRRDKLKQLQEGGNDPDHPVCRGQ